MKAGIAIAIFITLVFIINDSQSHWWGRRRRRRRRTPQPPPEPNCVVSGWSAWSQCSHLCSPGEQSRDRRVIYRPTPHCKEPNLQEERDCGATNGGCQEHCDGNSGLCSCRSGYTLASDGKACQDIDECQPNGGRGPCSHACRNTDGSYFCTCPTGYNLGLDQKTCSGVDCGRPNLPLCPAPVYSDHLGDSCKQAMVSCPSGTRYSAQCHFHCPQDFAVAEITNFTAPFAKIVSKSNFQTVIPSTTCGMNAAGVAVWSNAGTFKNNYFCRRINDPPSDIILSKTTIKEHSPIGTAVGTISVVTPNDGDIITLSLQPSAGEYFFKLQGNSLSNTWVPRWKNLQGLKVNEYRIVIRATDQGNPPMWLDKQFNITVVNANDPPYSIRISNNSVMDTAALGHVVGTLSAIDYDGPRGSLRSSDFIWALIDNDGGRFDVHGAQVVVAAALDHQAHRYHRIVVNCTDRDPADPRWAQHSIIINVIDTNDSPKNIVFKPFKLYENASTGFLAGEFTAYDEDGDALMFSISKSDPDTLLTFELGSTSCSNTTINSIKHTLCATNLILKKSIDYEVKNSYPVKVTATDPDGSFAVGEFTVHVVNMNEPPSDITLSGDTVWENSPIGTFVGQLTISDPDTAQLSPQGHHCTVHPSKPFGVVGLNLVVSEASLNYETKSSYRVTVTCTDTGSPPFSLSKDFIIKIKDRNERPEYLTLTRSSIQEDARIGSTVGELLTRDPDFNTRSLTFHVKSPVNSPFEIGGSGNKYLVTRSRLDFETLQRIELLINVVDDGGLSFEQYFNITIIDVNEPPTDIVISRTTFPENSPPGSVIGTIRVNDPDFNSTASCLIINGDSQHLAVCGGLKLCAGNKNVDYEALGSTKTLHITLRCRDEFQLYVDKSFHIDVTDVNEPPSRIDITVHPVPENAINFMVGQLTVRDPDINQKYSCKVLFNGTESLLFAVDAPTLGLKTRRPLNFEKQRQHLVTVRCDDGVNTSYSQFTAFKDISISVLDINELPLHPCPNNIYVDEAASDGYVVWTISPSDPDNERNETEKRLGLMSAYQKQQLTISLKTPGPNFPFQIANEKYLVKMGKLDRRVQDVYNFSLNVSDDGMLVRLTNNLYQRYQGSTLSVVYTCRIRVLASGDQRLFLDVALSSNTISEDALNGTTVGTLSVINPKPGKTYRFALVEPESVPFKIVGHNLILVTGVPLDYETTNSTGVGVLVVDSDGTTSQRMFSIRITNVNERPIKMCLIGNKTVMELTRSDQIIGKIFIEDEDHKESKGICEKPSPSLDQSQSYSCSIDSNIIDVSSLRQSFYIDKSLVLHGNTTFDYKAKSQYLIPMMCNDILKPVHVIELVVTVHVKVNAVKPVWDFILSSNTIPEDAPNGTEIGSLSVTNAPPGNYKFVIPDSTAPFRVMGTKLVLVHGHPLDYETSNSTNLLIVSTNDAGFYVTKSFLIVITNVNEKPVDLCLLDAISVIPEKSPSNSVIGRLAIEDPDHPESKGICTKPSIVGPLHYYAYTCSIYSASSNIDDIKKKFYIDQSFHLNRKSDFDYNTKDVYNIPIMCRDKEKPIHLIEKVFAVRIQAPSCQPGYKFVGGICVCANGMSGPNCDRDPTICTYTICSATEVCVSHVNASNRCVSRIYQVPILLQLPYSTSSPLEKRYKVEGYVESIFEGRRPPGQTLSSLFGAKAASRRRRDIPKDIYVEGASWIKVLSFYTYTIFVAMDPQSSYEALAGNKMCALLKGTDLRCVNEEDCVLLKKAGIDCPYIFSNSGGADGNKGQSKSDSSSGSTMPAVYAGVAACFVLVAIIVILLLINRKRHRKSDQVIYFHDIQDPTADGMDNPAYGGISPDHSPQTHPHNAERSKILRNNQTTQASSRKPDDIKTFNNKLYSLGKYDKNNPLYDAVGHLPPPPPPHANDPVYESIGKRLGKDTVNSMLEEEKVKSREKGFEEEVVAPLPNEQKGKWLEPEYRSVENFQKKRRNPNYSDMAGKKASISKKRFEEGVVALPVDTKGKLNEPVYSTLGYERGKPGSARANDLKQKEDKDSNC